MMPLQVVLQTRSLRAPLEARKKKQKAKHLPPSLIRRPKPAQRAKKLLPQSKKRKKSMRRKKTT